MEKKPDEDEEPTQQTPQGYTIPVPSREQFFADLEKVAKAKPNGDKLSRRRRRRRAREE